jgi:hypothetical protein
VTTAEVKEEKRRGLGEVGDTGVIGCYDFDEVLRHKASSKGAYMKREAGGVRCLALPHILSDVVH